MDCGCFYSYMPFCLQTFSLCFACSRRYKVRHVLTKQGGLHMGCSEIFFNFMYVLQNKCPIGIICFKLFKNNILVSHTIDKHIIGKSFKVIIRFIYFRLKIYFDIMLKYMTLDKRLTKVSIDNL